MHLRFYVAIELPTDSLSDFLPMYDRMMSKIVTNMSFFYFCDVFGLHFVSFGWDVPHTISRKLYWYYKMTIYDNTDKVSHIWPA